MLIGLGLNDSLGYLIESFKSYWILRVVYYAISLIVLESAAKAQIWALSENGLCRVVNYDLHPPPKKVRIFGLKNCDSLLSR